MKKVLLIIGAWSVIVVVAVGMLFGRTIWRDQSNMEQSPDVSLGASYPQNIMKITSPAFDHNESLPPDYTCDGKGMNPPMTIRDVPAAAQSLVLFLDDPDAVGGTFDHWVLWNIDPAITAISEGETPQGAVGKNSAGGNAYFPPCPPTGEHRYFFKLYALDTMLSLPAGSSKATVERTIEGHVLDSAELIGLYNRKKS